MVISVTLNETKTFFDAPPSKPLSEVLRENNFLSVKEGCCEGKCGFCSVLLDGRAVPSCSIPVGLVNNCEIMTLEHFSKKDEYKDIAQGFEKAGVKMCGFCNASKIFSVHNLINDYYKSDKDQFNQIKLLAENMVCNCVEKKDFINGVLYSVSNRHRRDDFKKVR